MDKYFLKLDFPLGDQYQIYGCPVANPGDPVLSEVKYSSHYCLQKFLAECNDHIHIGHCLKPIFH